MSKWPIGVFTSVDHGLGVHLEVAQELGIPTVQLHSPSKEKRNQKDADDFLAKCNGIKVTAVFGGFTGESYADIATTARTVGLVPQETREERVAIFKDVSDYAAMLQCDTVGMHIGFVTEDRDSDDYKNLIAVTRDILDHVGSNDQRMHLETGQETADHLLQFIDDVERDNLFINFDPANMILYGTGEPIEALQKVGKFVRSVHCKDAKWAAEDKWGVEWGQEVPLGEGDVDMETYLRTLKEVGYEGPLTIEREIPEDREQQKADISHAANLLIKLREKIG